MFILALVVGVTASTCGIQEAVTTKAKTAYEEPLISSPVLVEMYGPASFDHEKHQIISKECASCHHNSQDKTPPCQECHSTPFNPDNLNKPGIARVYHLQCIGCHTEYQKGPTKCTGCHIKASIPPLSISHPLTGNGNCIGCHGDGIQGVPKLPIDHDSTTNSVCILCHLPAHDEVEIAVNNLPHKILGQENCLLCHGEGIGKATMVSSDHTGRTNETCYVCHKYIE